MAKQSGGKIECPMCRRFIDERYITENGCCEECLELTNASAEPDDPQCICGVYRSEHALCGCPEGFQSAESWKAEREFIASLDEDEYERIYHPYGY